METLESRRERISLKFAKRALKNEKFREWFAIEENKEPKIKTRAYKQKPKLKPVTFRRQRFKKSPIPYLTDLLNKQK